MKKILFLIIFCFISFENQSNKKLEQCLGNEEVLLLKEGRDLFETILKDFYPKQNEEEVYKSYFRDLTIASDNLFVLESDFRALSFIEKLRESKMIGFFWSKEMYIENSSNKAKEVYDINKNEYLNCLIQFAKTKNFQLFFSSIKNEGVDMFVPAIIAGEILYDKSKVMKKDKELLRFFVAFHFYFQSILNNEQER